VVGFEKKMPMAEPVVVTERRGTILVRRLSRREGT
jgi:hypothetical protein